MSTRANVKIVNKNGDTVWLYKHHDGYPTHTGDILEFAFNGRFNTVPNNCKEQIDYLLDNGFEITTEQHEDINWLYTIKCGGTTSDNDLHTEWDIEITEYYFQGESKVQDARFSGLGKSSQVWNKYKIYEMQEAIKEAKHKLQYYETRSI